MELMDRAFCTAMAGEVEYLVRRAEEYRGGHSRRYILDALKARAQTWRNRAADPPIREEDA